MKKWLLYFFVNFSLLAACTQSKLAFFQTAPPDPDEVLLKNCQSRIDTLEQEHTLVVKQIKQQRRRLQELSESRQALSGLANQVSAPASVQLSASTHSAAPTMLRDSAYEEAVNQIDTMRLEMHRCTFMIDSLRAKEFAIESALSLEHTTLQKLDSSRVANKRSRRTS